MESKPASELTLDEAKEVIKKCIRICYLRDCRASAKYVLATVTAKGATIEPTAEIDSDWEYAKNVKGF